MLPINYWNGLTLERQTWSQIYQKAWFLKMAKEAPFDEETARRESMDYQFFPAEIQGNMKDCTHCIKLVPFRQLAAGHDTVESCRRILEEEPMWNCDVKKKTKKKKKCRTLVIGDVKESLHLFSNNVQASTFSIIICLVVVIKTVFAASGWLQKLRYGGCRPARLRAERLLIASMFKLVRLCTWIGEIAFNRKTTHFFPWRK